MLDPAITPEQSKRAIIAHLFTLMSSDHEENIKELGYIMYVGQQLGLTDEDLQEIKINKENYALKPPIEERERIIILYYFLFFMKADGKISPEEEDIVSHLGMKLGFRPDMTRDLIGVLKKHMNDDVPPDELLAKIKAYLN